MKSRAGILLIVLLIVNRVGAQGINPYLYFDSGYSIDRFDPTGINEFNTTFNDFWGNELDQGWDEISEYALSHPFIGVGVKGISSENAGLSWAIGYQYGKGGFKNSTTWASSVIQQYHFTAKHHQWTANMGLAIKSTYLFDLYISGTIKVLGLRFSTVYPDGSESIGTEYKLNGYYNGLTSAFEFGPQFTYRKGMFGGFIRMSWVVPNFPPAKGMIPLIDDSNNHYPPTDFPANYTTYATDPVAFVENGDGLMTDNFEGSRISIGITLLLGGNKY